MRDKESFIKTFFPDTVKDIQLVTIDLDITNLTLCDILRNVNRSFPKNSRERNRIIDGNKVVAVLCRSETLTPYNGIIMLICSDNNDIEITSRNYIVISVSEKKITNEESLNEIIEKLTLYLGSIMKDKVADFNNFYVKYMYNDYEYEKLYGDE